MEIGKLIVSIDSISVTKAADELSRLNAEIEKLLSAHNLIKCGEAKDSLSDLIGHLKLGLNVGYFNG